MAKSPEKGNFVSEWFGFRTYPRVGGGDEALRSQRRGRCPFLTAATREVRDCVKAAPSAGVCTINNASNGEWQDWLVCPYRALDLKLIEGVVRRLFDVADGRALSIAPAPALANTAIQTGFSKALGNGESAFVYLQNKLGGEISVSATDHSPELSFDTTVVELAPADGYDVGIGRFGVLEIQTMDFHGSYRQAVNNLRDSLRLHGPDFANILQQNQRWLAEKIEGPNIANVFKRTFYQMMLKFQLGMHARSVGTALAVPQAVWDSWQPHLGRPRLVPRDDGTHALAHPDARQADSRAWIYVFDIDTSSPT